MNKKAKVLKYFKQLKAKYFIWLIGAALAMLLIFVAFYLHLPALSSATIIPAILEEGGSYHVVVLFKGNCPKVTVTAFNKPQLLFPLRQNNKTEYTNWEGVLAVPWGISGGTANVTINVANSFGHTLSSTVTISVKLNTETTTPLYIPIELFQKIIQGEAALNRIKLKSKLEFPFVLPTYNNCLRLPVVAKTSSRFGASRKYQAGNLRMIKRHQGIDFSIVANTPVRAAASGLVVVADEFNAFGNAIIIDHGNGLSTKYFHLNKLLVAQGDLVRRGQVIARSGSTGLSTGNHLHWQVELQGTPVNPQGLLRKVL